MRRIYLIRHGMPDFPSGERCCLGHTDMPLGRLGRLQCCLLGQELGMRGLTVFSSPLSRAVDTAKFISTAPIVLDGLKEMYAGDWDGLSFSDIKKGWPELFSLRGPHPETEIPGAEPARDGQRRFISAVLEALSGSEGDIAVVAHSTVNQSLICAALGLPPTEGRNYKLRYASYSLLSYDGAFHLDGLDILPHPALDDALCFKLLNANGCDPRIVAHCAAVAEEASRIARELDEAGVQLDSGLIRSSALLHDIARMDDRHSEKGAELLCGLGYPPVGDIIRRHHDLDGAEIDEAAVVFMADKCVSEDVKVSVSERFARSAEKCTDAAALECHRKRYAAAAAVMNRINSICEKEIIK